MNWGCRMTIAPFTFIYNSSIVLTSIALCPQIQKYGIPLPRYTVFLQDVLLGYDPKYARFPDVIFIPQKQYQYIYRIHYTCLCKYMLIHIPPIFPAKHHG